EDSLPWDGGEAGALPSAEHADSPPTVHIIPSAVADSGATGSVVQTGHADVDAPIPGAHGESPPVLNVIPAAAATYPLDLETALGLAGVANPTIALAQEAVRASLAEQMRARALLFPTLDAGMNLNVHRGNLQSSQGAILDVDRQAFFIGAGAD